MLVIEMGVSVVALALSVVALVAAVVVNRRTARQVEQWQELREAERSRTVRLDKAYGDVASPKWDDDDEWWGPGLD